MDDPIFHGKTIGNLESLAWVLGRPASKLINVASYTNRYYIPNKPIIKSNGNIRQTFIVKQPLRIIQVKILRGILDHVEYPQYLQGAVKGRDFITDAKIHIGNNILLHEDIKNFFPSISFDHVLSIWKFFFHFHPDVANLLALLTTYDGVLPQGASTSTALANLIFWDREPKLVDNLRERGLTYSRFVDDIQVSSKSFLSQDEIGGITSDIYRMIHSVGLRPQRRKREVQTNGKICVHRLNLHSGKPTMNRKQRSNIRAEVRELETLAYSDLSDNEFEIKYARLIGRLNHMARLHPQQAKEYLSRVKALRRK